MNTIIQINSDELDNRFIESIKTLFKSKKLIISITEDIDETAYLLQSKNNANRLFEALKDVKQNKNLVTVSSVEVLNAYEVWKEKSMYGRKYMGVERTTFIIDGKGKIQKIFNKVKVQGHNKEVFEAIKDENTSKKN